MGIRVGWNNHSDVFLNVIICTIFLVPESDLMDISFPILSSPERSSKDFDASNLKETSK